MDAMERFSRGRAEVLESIDRIEALFANPDEMTMATLSHSLRDFRAELRRHEELEGERLGGLFQDGPVGMGVVHGVNLARREHDEIAAMIDALLEVLLDLHDLPFSYWRRAMDRETIHAQVGQVLRFIREHIRREDALRGLKEGGAHVRA